MTQPSTRSALSIRSAAKFCLIFGLPLTVLGGIMALPETSTTSAELVTDTDATLLGIGIGLTLVGVYGFWFARKPRSDILKASTIAVLALFGPLTIAVFPLTYSVLCSLVLRTSGYERCEGPDFERAYATGSGRTRRVPMVFARRREGGCAALMQRL